MQKENSIECFSFIADKPTEVNIITEDQPMNEGTTYHLQCQSIGGDPPARITWYLDGIEITDGIEENVSFAFPKVQNDRNFKLNPLLQGPDK